MDFEQELTRVADVYRGRGYAVTVRPGPDQLPPFAKDFKVEIVGRRGADGVLVAVKKNRTGFAADGNMQRYAEVTAAEPAWRFDFAILEPESPGARDFSGATEFSDHDITFSLDQADQLSRGGFARAALVTAWAALEAAMRIRLRASGQKAGWGSAPRQMVRELYSAGILLPDEFRHIETALQRRNQIVHGFSSQPDGSDAPVNGVIQLLSNVTRRLVAESQAEKLPA